MSLLVILPHRDDEGFPLGGRLAKYAAHPSHVTLVCTTWITLVYELNHMSDAR
jgi:LmbE family N-acetylglucosaminyl deacetylase